MSEEPAQPGDPVMATFHDWLSHVAVCLGACRLEAISCHHSMRLGDRHREARRAARSARQSATHQGLPPRRRRLVHARRGGEFADTAHSRVSR